MFKVVSTSGEKFVLRFYTDVDSSLVENRMEMFWLNALHRDTDLRVVEPVARRDGGLITLASLPGTSTEQRCALYRWIPGRQLVEQVSPEYYYQLGRMMAELHTHTESLRLPADIQPKRWDKVFYYPDEVPVYHQPEFRPLFPPERITLLDRVIERCNGLLAALYQRNQPPILIHGDLQYYNVHVYRKQLYLLDFEDMVLGYPVQDVAITLYYGTDRPDYANLASAYQEGYTSLRPWVVESKGQLEGLWAARLANFINYVLVIESDPREILDGMFTRLHALWEKMGA